MSMPWKTQKSLLAHTVETPKGAFTYHPLNPIIISCEPWPWLTDSFAMAVVTCSVHNDNTTVGGSIYIIQLLTLAFSDSWRRNLMGSDWFYPLIQSRLTIHCCETFHAKKKLVVQTKDIIAGVNRTEYNLPIWVTKNLLFTVN